MATPILTSIGSLNALVLLDTTILFEVESTTEGSKKLTVGELSNFIITAAGSTFYSKTEADSRYYQKTEVYNRTEADARYKGINAQESWNNLLDKPAVIAAGATAADARTAIGAGTSNLTLGTEAGTAAAGDDIRIVNAIQSSEKGAINGVATLNEVGQVPSTQLPSFVDDVLEFTDLASFPVSGESGKIYVALDSDLTYRWTGTVYRRIADGDVTSVNGRKGAVTGLAEQSSLDTVAGDRYTKTESDNRYKPLSAQESWNNLTDKPTFIAAGASAADVRTSLDVYSTTQVNDLLTASESAVMDDVNLALTGYYTKSEADLRYKAIGAQEAFADLTDVPSFVAALAAATSIEEARAAVGAGDSFLTIGTTAGTAAEGNDPRIVNAIQSSEKGVANGVATLNASGLIPTEQLPSFVDDVLEFADLATFPATGESGKIYVALDTDLTYRWGGSDYRRIADGDVASVNGRKGVVTGLAEQSALDTVASERYTKTESDDRYVAKDTSNDRDKLYGRSLGVDIMVRYSSSNDADSLVQRDAQGRAVITDGVNNNHAVSVAQLGQLETDVNDTVTYLSERVDNVGSELISYSLPVATTTGAADLNNGQVFVVDEGTGPRTVTLTVPSNAVDRSFVYVLKVIGDNAVTWPSEIDWVDETAPILASGYTIVNLLYIDGGWIGNVLIAKDSIPLPV